MNELPDLPTYIFEPSAAGILSTLLTFVLPLLTALLAKQSWSATAKGVLLLFLSAVKVFLEALIAHMNAGVAYNPWVILYGVVFNFLVAVGIYFGLLRGSTVQNAFANSGNTDSKVMPIQ